MSPTKMALRAKLKSGLATALLFTVAGCVGYVDQPRGNVRVASVQPVSVAQEDYVYYPGYQTYYGSRSHQYYYQEGSAWVSRPAPPRVSLSVFAASPSVQMNFHDSPATHHSEVIRTYPTTWKKPQENNAHQGDRKDDSHDDKKDDRR